MDDPDGKYQNCNSKRQKMDESCIIVQGTVQSENKTNSDTKCVQNDKKSLSMCQFFVKRKQRTCKSLANAGKLFCVEHSYLSKNVSERKRVPCPMDPKHSCYEDQLEKHLRKCNARQDLRPICFEENINLSDDHQVTEKNQGKFILRDVPKEELFEVIEKCKTLYSKYKEELSKTEILFHSVMEVSANDPKNGNAAKKHIMQQASLIGHMDRLQLLNDNHCYIEFGAGKGGLSHFVQKAIPSQNTQFVLVDKSSVRYKMDNFHKREDQGPSFERLKIDIQHLNLDKVSTLQNDRSIVGIGKHLCGGATDLMLRCIVKTLNAKEGCDRYIKGITLAMCCHHRCDWNSYTGKMFFKENNISVHQFNIMCSMTSWAVCGNRSVEGGNYEHHFYGNLRPQDREEIGLQVKRLIELGRVQYLNDNGFVHAELVHFVSKDCTPENVCLVATKENLTNTKESDDIITTATNIAKYNVSGDAL